MTQIQDLYLSFRKEILTRHFATGNYFVANHMTSCGNILSYPAARFAKRELYLDLWTDLGTNAIPETVEKAYTKEVWDIRRRDRENPLIDDGRLLIIMSVEHKLGSPYAVNIIKSVLHTIETLMKYTSKPGFEGYIVRMDPVSCDDWDLDEYGNPLKCRQFLMNHDGTYSYCTNTSDGRYNTMVPREGTKWELFTMEHMRRWEPSQDEYIGLLGGLMFTFEHVNNTEVKNKIKGIVNNIGKYFQHNAYFLVRPEGGMTFRGAAGAIQGLSYPIQRICKRITGNAYVPNCEFEDVLCNAGIRDRFDMTTAAVLGFLGNLVIPGIVQIINMLSFMITGLGSSTDTKSILYVISEMIGPTSLPIFLKTLALAKDKDKFECANDGYNSEFLLGFLMHNIYRPIDRLQVMQLTYSLGKHSKKFFTPLAIGLARDSDRIFRETYLNIFDNNRNNYDDINANVFESVGATNPLAYAATLIIRKSPDDATNMMNMINKMVNKITENKIKWLPTQHIEIFGEKVVYERSLYAIDFMTCVALAWLYKSETPSDKTIPEYPDFKTLPPIYIEEEVIRQAKAGKIRLPQDIINAGIRHPLEPQPGESEMVCAVPLFVGSNLMLKPKEPPLYTKPISETYCFKMAHIDSYITEKTHTETRTFSAPYIPKHLRNKYMLTVSENILPASVYSSFDIEDGDRIRISENPDEVTITVKLHTDSAYGHGANFEALYTLEWIPLPAQPLKTTYRLRVEPRDSGLQKGNYEEVKIIKAPYIPTQMRSQYMLTVNENILSDTVWQSIDADDPYRVQIMGNPDEVLITVKMHTDGSWGHGARFTAIYTLEWVLLPAEPAVESHHFRIEPIDSSVTARSYIRTMAYKAPFIPAVLRNKYRLTAREEILADTVWKCFDPNDTNRVQIRENPDEVHIFLQVHTDGGWGHGARFEARYTLEWVKK